MLWRHVSKVHHHTNGMRMNPEQRRAISVAVVAFYAGFQREGFSIIRRRVILGKMETRDRLLGDVLADGRCERRVTHKVCASRMDGERTGRMASVTSRALELD